MLRVLHFSDVHVDAPLSRIPVSDFEPKRILGALNLKLRRQAHFSRVHEKLELLAPFAREADLVLCTGDYTALGSVAELQAARAAIEPFTLAHKGFVTLPGNHDLYVNSALTESRFERFFGEFLKTDRPDLATDGVWPQVRLIGDDVAVVAIKSARPNPQLWRSSGEIPDAHLSALQRILADAEVARRFVFVMLHYGLYRRDGKPDSKHHGIVNADALLSVLQGLRRGAVLHGHIHWRYTLGLSEGARIFCAGSATHEHREGFWMYEINGTESRAIPGRFHDGNYVLDEAAAVRW